ncbi:MAG: hypothetical protein QOG62_958 [Thermoleophilaceae bacterium]|nr:hypothetical protein [Thermoleophilaceae bacterium]
MGPRPLRTLTRKELTAALAARQMLLERQKLSPTAAIARLTPLQGQHSPAPFVALAARLDGFARPDLERALSRGSVVKTTIMRHTLHLAAGADYPAYAQLSRQTHLRAWRNRYRHLDEAKVVAELGEWFTEPRTNPEIREKVGRYEGVTDEEWVPISFARTVLPLVQVPPAGYWSQPRLPLFVVDPRPLPSPADAAELALRRYLAAFGPASRRDMAAWAGATQRDFTDALVRVKTVSYVDEQGTELFDLPGRPLPPASTPIPVRLLARWDQPLLAHADRARIIPPEIEPLKLTHSGDQTVTVDGRVAASWQIETRGEKAKLLITSHADIPRSAMSQIRAEGQRMAAILFPEIRNLS